MDMDAMMDSMLRHDRIGVTGKVIASSRIVGGKSADGHSHRSATAQS
jgi:hypothetical protein